MTRSSPRTASHVPSSSRSSSTSTTWQSETLSCGIGWPLVTRLRVGNYRVIYAVGDDVVTVLAIGHGRDIYD
jgi:hypothetical protein